MKLLKQILEAQARNIQTDSVEIVTESNWVEVDGESLTIGPYLVWVSAYSLDAKKHIDEIVLRVFNRETHQTYKVVANPATPIDPSDVDSGLRGLEYMVWDLTNNKSGTVVKDEETEQLISSMAYKFLVRQFDEVVNPDTSDYDPSDDTYEQRREKMRQAAAARSELDID